MKKVGITTMYYKSNNYGGNLQAYALAYYINKISNTVSEQICIEDSVFVPKPIKTIKEETAERTVLKRATTALRHPISAVKKLFILIRFLLSKQNIKQKYNDYMNKKNAYKYSVRDKAIFSFNTDMIPHSKEVYSESNLKECVDLYDIFVTGSDQVWSYCSDAFSLRFVEGKPKISYAASVSRKEISTEQKEYFKERLTDFKAISVRDEADKKIISELTEKNVSVVLDPTLLLDANDWNQIAPSGRKIQEKYVFCYFLGDIKKYKNVVRRFAKKNKLKLVIIPDFKNNHNGFVANDLFYGDLKPYDVSPADFVALIRDAEYVFTDSFHATVFSIIYQKQFFVFDRDSFESMNSRIVSILSRFGLMDRFCYGEDRENYEYLRGLNSVDYSGCNEILRMDRKFSTEFLIENLK